MPEVTIPTGQERDGWIVIGVNGVLQWIKAGVPTELDTSEIEVLQHADISYALANGTEPLIFADFKNGVYMVDGEAVTMGDVIEENLDYGPFNPDLVELGVGLHDPLSTGENGPCLKQSLSSTLPLGLGCTIVVNFVGNSFTLNMLDLPGWNNAYAATFDNHYLQLGDGSGPFVEDRDNGASYSKIAVNLGMARLAGSIDGRPVIGIDTYNAADPEGAVPFNTSAVVVSNPGVIESVGWYPLQDEADLPSLSAL